MIEPQYIGRLAYILSNNDEQTTWNLLSMWIFRITDRESGTNIIPMLLQKSNWKQTSCALNVNQPMIWTLVSPWSCINTSLPINPNFIFDSAVKHYDNNNLDVKHKQRANRSKHVRYTGMFVSCE